MPNSSSWTLGIRSPSRDLVYTYESPLIGTAFCAMQEVEADRGLIPMPRNELTKASLTNVSNGMLKTRAGEVGRLAQRNEQVSR
jgi:hypothetical protein